MLVLDPALARIVVEEADRAQPQLGVAHQLADDEAAAVAAADDQDLAGALADPEAADPAVADQLHGEAGADQQRQREQEEQGDHARRAACTAVAGPGPCGSEPVDVWYAVHVTCVVDASTGCSSAIAPTTTTVATTTALSTAS